MNVYLVERQGGLDWDENRGHVVVARGSVQVLRGPVGRHRDRSGPPHLDLSVSYYLLASPHWRSR